MDRKCLTVLRFVFLFLTSAEQNEGGSTCKTWGLRDGLGIRGAERPVSRAPSEDGGGGPYPSCSVLGSQNESLESQCDCRK